MSTVKRRGQSWQATYRAPGGRERTRTFGHSADMGSCHRLSECHLGGLTRTLFGADDGIRTRDPHLGNVICHNCATSDFIHLSMFYWAFGLP